MNKLKSLLSQNLTWTFSKKKITLKSNDETIVELQEEKSTRATFELDGKNYIIRNEGFWNAKTIIEKDGRRMLILKRNFLGSKGNIEFDNGNLYSWKITNSPLVKLSFFNKDEKEILYYKLEPKPKPKTVLNIVDNSLNEKELLMLIILGCYSFKGIAKENGDSDFILLVAGA
jgi:hypothetical protein